MTVGNRLPIVLFAASACAESAPREGNWSLSVDAALENTCVWDDEAFGVGSMSFADLARTDSGFSMTNPILDDRDEPWVFMLDGAAFVADNSTLRPLMVESCVLVVDCHHEGEFDGPTEATARLTRAYTEGDGDCSELDMSSFPCRATTSATWTYSGK